MVRRQDTIDGWTPGQDTRTDVGTDLNKKTQIPQTHDDVTQQKKCKKWLLIGFWNDTVKYWNNKNNKILKLKPKQIEIFEHFFVILKLEAKNIIHQPSGRTLAASNTGPSCVFIGREVAENQRLEQKAEVRCVLGS